MYKLEKISTIYRDSPWNIPLEDRLQKLRTSKRLGKKTVGYLYPRFDSSTFRYRGYNICESLDYSFEWGGAYFQLEELEAVKKEADNIDVFVIIRCPWDETIEEFVSNLKKREIKICYDIDDLVYSPIYYDQLASALGLKQDFELNFWHGLMYRNEKLIKQCDCLITTNEFLAGYMRKDFDKPCFVIPNYLNMLQEEVSAEYLRAKRSMKSEECFEIGYFSGSPTHAKDLMVALPAIETFLNENKDARLKIVGYMELSEKYNYLVNAGKVIFAPFTSMTGLQYEQACVDVNIVPLLNNTFSNCKSELKYFETAIVGTRTLATPVYTYAHAIEDGKNGYLCNDEEQWYCCLSKMYGGEYTDRKMDELATSALNIYSNSVMVELIESILGKILYS